FKRLICLEVAGSDNRPLIKAVRSAFGVGDFNREGVSAGLLQRVDAAKCNLAAVIPGKEHRLHTCQVSHKRDRLLAGDLEDKGSALNQGEVVNHHRGETWYGQAVGIVLRGMRVVGVLR